MALGGIQVISPDVKLFYKKQNNSAEEGEFALSPTLPLPPILPPFLRIFHRNEF